MEIPLRYRRPLWRIARSLLFIVVATTGCAFMLVDHFIFYPDRSPAPVPPGVTEHFVTTEDGVRIHMLALRARDEAPTLLWSHGNAGNISQRAYILPMLVERGLSVVAYDYRGYGKSDGSPTEEGAYLDARAAYDAVTKMGVPPSRIVLFGESLGGAVSLQLATERKCAAVVVSSTFTRIRDVGKEHYGPFAMIVGNKFDSLSRVGRIGVPLFVAHGDEDELIPFALGEALFAAAKEPKEFMRVKHGSHNDVIDRDDYLDAVADFVKRHVR